MFWYAFLGMIIQLWFISVIVIVFTRFNIGFATALLALEYVRDDTTRGDVLSEKIGKLAWTFGSRQHGENGMTQEILSFLKPLKATTVKFTII